MSRDHVTLRPGPTSGSRVTQRKPSLDNSVHSRAVSAPSTRTPAPPLHADPGTGASKVLRKLPPKTFHRVPQARSPVAQLGAQQMHSKSLPSGISRISVIGPISQLAAWFGEAGWLAHGHTARVVQPGGDRSPPTLGWRFLAQISPGTAGPGLSLRPRPPSWAPCVCWVAGP